MHIARRTIAFAGLAAILAGSSGCDGTSLEPADIVGTWSDSGRPQGDVGLSLALTEPASGVIYGAGTLHATYFWFLTVNGSVSRHGHLTLTLGLMAGVTGLSPMTLDATIRGQTLTGTLTGYGASPVPIVLTKQQER
jgi:hypothetical protein